MLEVSGPVPAFMEALLARDLPRVASMLAHDVLLSVPPVRLTRRGNQDALQAIMVLLHGYGELRYDVRRRYLAPGAVTDEAVLTGRQTGPFLGTQPSRRVNSVPARVIIAHDAAMVTSITVWPDLASLRQAMAGVARLIDLTRASNAGGMVAELRASIPPSPARVYVGTARESTSRREVALVGEPDEAPSRELPSRELPSRRGPARETPKPPVPRSVRRRRAFMAGSAMLAASTAITMWVAVGALRTPTGGPGLELTHGGGPAATGKAAGRSGAGGQAAGSAADLGPDGSIGGATGQGGTAGPGMAAVTPPQPSPAPTTLKIIGNVVTVPSDLLFDFDEYELTAKARKLLGTLIAQAQQEHRTGRVVVNGYTDDRGTPAYNLTLSKRRAEAVAAALEAGLKGTGMRFTANGYGSIHPAVKGTSEQARALNRRVTVRFQAVKPAPSQTTSA